MEFTSLSDALIGLIPIYGPWIIFGIVAFESAGVPLPGETILVAAALLAATTGQINIVVVVLAAAIGAIVGDGIGYMVGRRLGFPLLRRYGRYIRLDEDRLLIGRYLFFSMATPSCSSGVSLQCYECLQLCLPAPLVCRQLGSSSSI
jgi:membrane protein DedA with SNARE-associated domain